MYFFQIYFYEDYFMKKKLEKNFVIEKPTAAKIYLIFSRVIFEQIELNQIIQNAPFMVMVILA